jgi:hypothetical protein
MAVSSLLCLGRSGGQSAQYSCAGLNCGAAVVEIQGTQATEFFATTSTAWAAVQ